MYRPSHPASGPDIIIALRRLLDSVVDGTAIYDSTDSLDTIYATINYLAAAERLCVRCGKPLTGPHADCCPGGILNATAST